MRLNKDSARAWKPLRSLPEFTISTLPFLPTSNWDPFSSHGTKQVKLKDSSFSMMFSWVFHSNTNNNWVSSSSLSWQVRVPGLSGLAWELQWLCDASRIWGFSSSYPFWGKSLIENRGIWNTMVFSLSPGSTICDSLWSWLEFWEEEGFGKKAVDCGISASA